MKLSDFVDLAALPMLREEDPPWEICRNIAALVAARLAERPSGFRIGNGIAIHESAVIEPNVTIKPPCLIGPGCFVAAYAYLRGGVYLCDHVTIGPSVEIKSSFILPRTAIAHLNFIGDSLIGSRVNIEAGAIIANRRNDRADKRIEVMIDGRRVATGSEKFGALVGDDCRIGANAVLSPGTILKRGTIVGRLQLVDQLADPAP
jgi:bifunctional N-acetylglucosamine-1-phosphate-uridyltransferase/glucosamine-1-phosphate-acetyltransferase GlmU-like protein